MFQGFCRLLQSLELTKYLLRNTFRSYLLSHKTYVSHLLWSNLAILLSCNIPSCILKFHKIVCTACWHVMETWVRFLIFLYIIHINFISHNSELESLTQDSTTKVSLSAQNTNLLHLLHLTLDFLSFLLSAVSWLWMWFPASMCRFAS